MSFEETLEILEKSVNELTTEIDKMNQLSAQ